MLDETLKQQLSTYLTNVKQPIILRQSLDSSDTSNQMQELLQTIAGLSDNVSYEDNGTSAHRPCFSIINPTSDTKIEFGAIPLGHEFNSLVLALLQVGGHPIKSPQNVIDAIKNINYKCEFVSYISLSCQNCPDVVQTLNIMAILNPNISH